MVETGLLAGQLVNATSQQNPQSLPSAQARDVDRFQDLMKGNTDASTTIQPQSMDNSVLQLVEPGQNNDSAGLVDKMINQATKIDDSYHSLLDQMGNRPGFDSYLNAEKDAPSAEMLTYPQVNVEAAESDPYKASIEGIENVNKATLAYQSDMNTWAMDFKIWSVGVEIVAAAAKKVSQGFQTLFRASG